MTPSPQMPDFDALRQISPLPVEAMRIVGEAHSEWAPLRRKYHLFLSHTPPSEAGPTEPLPPHISLSQRTKQEPSFVQFASINEPFLAWDFSLLSANNTRIGSVNRHFRGFGRELFTDTGSYALRMDAAAIEDAAAEEKTANTVARAAQMGIGHRAYAEAVGGGRETGMTLDQRAVMLATAVTVDFDYFSRHSGSGGVGFMPFLWGGGEAAGGATAGGAAGAAGAGEAVGGAVVGGAGRAVGGAAAGAGVGEGAIAGAGTMAGYEAMQRGLGRNQDAGSETSTQQGGGAEGQMYGDGPSSQAQPPQQGGQEGESVWGTESEDPWSGQSSGAGDGGGEGGGRFLNWIWEMFFGD
jgi:hypothetical protein